MDIRPDGHCDILSCLPQLIIIVLINNLSYRMPSSRLRKIRNWNEFSNRALHIRIVTVRLYCVGSGPVSLSFVYQWPSSDQI